ncbi:MAG: hypothetical protein FJ197_01675 [Gammaproteobacteria bacterium]|nr:hypothetical protein [Gammaproteobacteria bacterium]
MNRPRTTRRIFTLLWLAAALLAALPAAAEEVRLRLGSAWSSRQNFTADFLRYVDAVNAAGRGVVRIDFLGGPEVIPEQQMLYALRRGAIDMVFGGMTYFLGQLPEGDAIYGATISPEQARVSGALDALQPYWASRANARLIGWVQTGIGSQVFLREAPPLRADGLPDLDGLLIRTSPSHREFVKSLGGRPVQIPLSEVYTALERGLVQGFAFTSIGVPDLGVNRFIRSRIDPPVQRLAMCLQINLDAWARLAPEGRALLVSEAIRYERGNRERFARLEAEEAAALEAAGVRALVLPPAQREAWERLALESTWNRFAKRAPASAAKLKPLFWPEGTGN